MSDIGADDTASTHSAYETAMAALANGDLAVAQRLIDRLAGDLDDTAPVAVRSRAARAAATLHRLNGNHASAEERVVAALALAAEPGNDDPLVAVQAELELGDLRRAQRCPGESAAAYERAGRLAKNAALPDAVRWQITLRLIDHDLATDPVRGVTRLTELTDAVPEIPPEAMASVPASMRALLQALDPVSSGDTDRALAALEVAATEARASEDVPVYVAARIAAAQIHDEADERVEAYESLAMGWATMRAAVSPKLARDAFEPLMLEFRARWGAEEFLRAKAAVEGHEPSYHT